MLTQYASPSYHQRLGFCPPSEQEFMFFILAINSELKIQDFLDYRRVDC